MASSVCQKPAANQWRPSYCSAIIMPSTKSSVLVNLARTPTASTRLVLSVQLPQATSRVSDELASAAEHILSSSLSSGTV